MKNHRLLAGTALIFLTAFSLGLCFGEEETTPLSGQTIFKENKPVVLRFGMYLNEVEGLLGAKSETVFQYKPVGIVKEIEYAGLRLHFQRERLTQMTYLHGFNFSLGLSPFGNPIFNPPALKDYPLKSRMTVEEFLIVARAWKESLRLAGYTEIMKLKELAPMKFYGKYHALKARHYYEFIIKHSLESPKKTGRKNIVFWDIEFTLDDKLKSLWAKDMAYGLTFVPIINKDR